MKKTKRKILDAAIALFNERGIHNVRLQQIADYCSISLGNLAYHFPLKEDLLVFVAEYISNDIDTLLGERHDFVHLIDFDNQLALYYDLINKYAFYFHDVMELQDKHEHIHAQRVVYIDQMINQVYMWLTANEQKSILKAELQQNQYRRLAHVIWMVIIFWMTQKRIRSDDSGAEEEFKSVVWNELLPNFTETGLLEYEVLIQPRLQEFQPHPLRIIGGVSCEHKQLD